MDAFAGLTVIEERAALPIVNVAVPAIAPETAEIVVTPGVRLLAKP